nr:isoform 2 of gamma-tubulin complex component 5 [Quercus suber]
MAHAASLGLLVEGLVTSLTGLTSRDTSFTGLRDRAGRTLKDGNNARTNQFAVHASYAGLVEKFQVVHRDALADALQSRLDELPTVGTKFMPEILSLLLLLSDKPAEKTELESVDNFSRSGTDNLTWSSIFADNPLDDNGLWDDIQPGYHSSGDDGTDCDINEGDLTISTLATSVEDEDFISIARQHVMPVDCGLLDDIRLTHASLSRELHGSPEVVSQLILSREILTMLHGLPTNLFSKEVSTGRIIVSRSFILATASKSTFSAMLSHFVGIGSDLNSIRVWSRAAEQVDWVQSIQASARTLLLRFANNLIEMERKYLSPTTASVVSLMELWTVVEKSVRPLSHLSTILDDCTAGSEVKTEPSSFALLDRLYDEVCLTQLADDTETFQTLSSIFTTAVRTYLRPISSWLRQGLLPDTNRHSFFVHDLDTNCSLADVWYDRYRLRSTSGGKLAVPSFMKPFIGQVFATGKTKAFLRLLPRYDNCADLDALEMDRMALTFGPLDSDRQQNVDLLLPYAEFLAEQLDNWLSQTAIDSTPALRKRLWLDHGLGNAMEALEYVYFAKDGSLFEAFAESLSTRISNSQQAAMSSTIARESWKDNFILSELAHNTLGMSAFVDAQNMTVRCLESSYGRSMSAAVSITQELSILTLDYHFSWPIQNITREKSPAVHGRALTFLLQIQFARSRLSVQLLDLRPLNKTDRSHSQSVMKAFKIRQRLLWFLDIMHNHVTSSCSVQHKELLSQMANADGIDSMASVWTEYTKHLETSLLIADKLAPVRNTVIKIIELCEQFTDLWAQLMRAHQQQQTGLGADQGVEIQNSRTIEMLQEQFDSSFYFVVAGLRSIGRAGGDTALEMLAQRLDAKHG